MTVYDGTNAFDDTIEYDNNFFDAEDLVEHLGRGCEVEFYTTANIMQLPTHLMNKLSLLRLTTKTALSYTLTGNKP